MSQRESWGSRQFTQLIVLKHINNPSNTRNLGLRPAYMPNHRNSAYSTIWLNIPTLENTAIDKEHAREDHNHASVLNSHQSLVQNEDPQKH